MKIDSTAVRAANKVVAAMDKRNINGYVTLAKAALWITAWVFLFVLIASLRRFWTAEYEGRGWYYDSQAAGVVVSSAQGLMALAIAVLGFHSYKGHRLLHVIRHWRDGDTQGKETPQ